MNANDPLAVALDHFTVPPMSPGLADRIVAASGTPRPFAPARRDRRGMWRRGRQVVLGSLALGMVSAAAVASGLLGKVGIEVPVLSAMLAPKPKPVAVVQAKPKARPAPKPVAALPAEVIEAPIVVPTVPTREERIAQRIERRERIAAFAEKHPQVAAIIKRRVREQIVLRETERRALLGLPPTDRSAPDWRPLTPEERFVLREERRRDLLRLEAMIARRIEARAARQAAQKEAAEAAQLASNASDSAPPPVAAKE